MLCAAVDVSDKWGEKMIDGLIRRSDAIEVLACEMYAEAQSQGYEVDSIEDFMPEAKAWMNDAPSADRPRGEWIRDRYWSRGAGMGEEYGFFYKCSLCEYEVESGYARCGFNFCPNCGARMYEEAKESE